MQPESSIQSHQNGLIKPKEKCVNSSNISNNNNNNNNNNNHNGLVTSKRSPAKVNLPTHKPVLLNEKFDRINQSGQSDEIVRDLLSPGDLVKDRWRVVCKLGGGGFGEIYEAVDTKLKRVQHSTSSSSSSSSCSSGSTPSNCCAELQQQQQPNVKRYSTEYSLCLNCATNSTLNAAVNSPILTGQTDSTLMKFKQQDVGSDSGIGGVQAFSSDTQILQHGTRINSAGTTTSASMSSRRFMLTCNENNNMQKNTPDDGVIRLQLSNGIQKITSQDFSVSNVSTPRESSQTGNYDSKKRICMSCKCELSQGVNDKSNGVSSDSGICSVNDAYDYRVAIKAESNRQARQVLRMEVAVLRRLQGKPNICRLFGCGKNAKFNYMVMTLQGKNLSEIRRTLPGAVFSLGTAFRLIKQCITALQTLHDAGFLHRDVKPSNFAIQRGKPKDNASQRIQVTLLDFGLARPYTINGPGSEVRNARQIAGFRGTVRYASINAHSHQDLARRDDLWSLVYMFIEFICGQLPWRRIRDKELVGQMKMALNHKELAIKSGLPVNIVTTWITHVEQLEYKSMPNYSLLISCLDEWLSQHKIQESDLYDWEISDHNLINNHLKSDQHYEQQHQQQHQQLKPGTITLYKPEHKPILTEHLSYKEIRTQAVDNPMNRDEDGKAVEMKSRQVDNDNNDDEEEDEDEHVNKMNETLKPNTLLQIVRDNHKVKLKQSSVNLNNRYSNSQCNLKIITGDNNNSHNKGQYDNKLLKQRNLLKDYGSLGADLISHDGDMENAIIVEGEYSQNKPNKLLSIIHNSADCILGDDDGDEMEEDIKDDVVLEASVSRNNVEKYDNKLNHLTIVDVQQNAKNEEAGKVNPQPPCISTLSNHNAEGSVPRKEATPVKDNLKIIDAKPIRNNCTERALTSNTKATGFLKNSTVNVTEASQSHQDVDGTTSCSMPQTSNCSTTTTATTTTTNARANIHAIIQNLLARHQNDDNEITPKTDDRIVHRYSDCTRPVTSPSSEKPEWNPNELNRVDRRSGRLDDNNNNITSSYLDLRVNSMLDKSISRSNKSSLLDHSSPFFIRFSSGYNNNINNNPSDSEQYHRFLTVPRKDHISLSTLRLSRTRQSVVNSETPSPTPEFDHHHHHHHRNRTSNENIENSCQTQSSINCQSERSHPVPRKKRTLYLNKSRTEQSLQSNHENILTINKSPYQNCLLFESNTENYRQKLIDNKQKHCQQKSMTTTRLAGPTIRSVLETGKSIHHPQHQHQQHTQHQQYAWNSSVTGTCIPTTTTTNNNNNISNCSSNSYSHLKENENRIKRTSLSEKRLNEKLVNGSYDAANYQQVLKKAYNINNNSSTMNQNSRNQRQLKPSTEVSFEPEISKTSLQQSSKLKRPTSKDSGLITNRSTSQPLQFSQKPPACHFSNEKSDNSGFQDINKRQTKHDYLPLKTTNSTLLITSSISSTNLTENLCIKPNNICSRSIHCQNTLDTSRRRLNSVHILTSELDHKPERNPPVTLTASGSSSSAKPSTVSKMNLRTLRSQSADRVLKPRTTCINTPYQTSYQLFQPYLTSTPTSRTKSKRITDILQYSSMHDSDKTYKPITPPFR